MVIVIERLHRLNLGSVPIWRFELIKKDGPISRQSSSRTQKTLRVSQPFGCCDFPHDAADDDLHANPTSIYVWLLHRCKHLLVKCLTSSPIAMHVYASRYAMPSLPHIPSDLGRCVRSNR